MKEDAQTSITNSNININTNVNKSNHKKSNEIEIQLSQESCLILGEALTLLYQVSQEGACQRGLIRPKWIAILINLSFFCPTNCRQQTLMLLSDLLPVANLDVSKKNYLFVLPEVCKKNLYLALNCYFCLFCDFEFYFYIIICIFGNYSSSFLSFVYNFFSFRLWNLMVPNFLSASPLIWVILYRQEM